MPRKKSSLNARLDMARKNNAAKATGAPNLNISAKRQTTSLCTPEQADLEPFVEGCICYRDPKTFVCIFCKMFSFGRITESCPVHPNVTYLMDFTCCPFCSGPAEHLHVVNMEYERYFT